MWEKVKQVPKRLAVLVSGRGTNLQAILDAVERGSLEMQVVGVFSDQPEPYAFQRARERDIPAVFVNPKKYSGVRSMMQLWSKSCPLFTLILSLWQVL